MALLINTFPQNNANRKISSGSGVKNLKVFDLKGGFIKFSINHTTGYYGHLVQTFGGYRGFVLEIHEMQIKLTIGHGPDKSTYTCPEIEGVVNFYLSVMPLSDYSFLFKVYANDFVIINGVKDFPVGLLEYQDYILFVNYNGAVNSIGLSEQSYDGAVLSDCEVWDFEYDKKIVPVKRTQYAGIKPSGTGKFSGVKAARVEGFPCNDIFRPVNTDGTGELNPFTVIIWFNSTSENSEILLSTKALQSSHHWRFLGGKNQAMFYFLSGWGAQKVECVLSEKVWNAAFVYNPVGNPDNHALKCYANGVLGTDNQWRAREGYHAININTTLTERLYIGYGNGDAVDAEASYSNYLSCNNTVIGSIQIFNKALSQKEINLQLKKGTKPLKSLESNFAGGWKVDQKSGLTVSDYSGNGNHATFVGFSNEDLGVPEQISNTVYYDFYRNRLLFNKTLFERDSILDSDINNVVINGSPVPELTISNGVLTASWPSGGGTERGIGIDWLNKTLDGKSGTYKIDGEYSISTGQFYIASDDLGLVFVGSSTVKTSFSVTTSIKNNWYLNARNTQEPVVFKLYSVSIVKLR